jgi:hypothetical protein
MNWEQGQHIAIVGSNGTGKTFLEARLLPLRRHVIVLRTKADDVKFAGFRKIKTIDGIRPGATRYELRPVYERQSVECQRAIELAWRQRGWCVAVDELFYLCDQLKLERSINKLLTQGRSLSISVVCGMQRPSRITRFALTEAIHGFFFRAEGRDVKLIAEATTPRIVPAIEALKRFEFAYFNRLNGEITIARAQDLGRL